MTGAPRRTIRLDHRARVGSANDAVLQLVAEVGAQEPLAVRADEQTAGRGRLGRKWLSPVGGLWLSCAWPIRAPFAVYASAPLLAGLAVRDVLADWLAQTRPGAGERIKLKWPNDLLVDGCKLGGILCESRPVDAPHANWLVVGVGVNATTPTGELGSRSLPAIGLTEAFGVTPDVAALAEVIVDRLAGQLSALEVRPLQVTRAARERIEPMLAYRRQHIRVIDPYSGAARLVGRLEGLDDELRLTISDANGRYQVCTVGEVEQLRRQRDDWEHDHV